MSARSTGALTPEQHAAQNERYQQGHTYDYVFIGSGNAALSAAALLAQAGNRVCLIEQHDTPGGYAHTFTYGDYSFCAQVHYVWGAQEGGKINQFLKKLGLEKELTFEMYDADGYDVMAMADGKKVKIPYGFTRVAKNVNEAYPGHEAAVNKFVDIMQRLSDSFDSLPPTGSPKWKYVAAFPKLLPLLKYRKATVQDVFEECNLPIEIQTVFAANAGDFGEPPNRLSIIPYVALMAGYDRGAFYPTQHYGGYIARIAQFIEDHGGHFYYETKVSKVNTEGSRVTSIETEDGKTFTAEKAIICNMDPQGAAKQLIGWEKFPAAHQKKLSYEYSPSGTMIYLGLKDMDLEANGFGKFNIWHFPEWDVNESWEKQQKGIFENPWFFVSTATLHSSAPGTAPANGHVMEIASNTSYAEMKQLYDTDRKAYARRKNEIAEMLIDQVARFWAPNLRDHIAMKVVGSPVTNERYVNSPVGNAYGMALTPENMKLTKVNANTPFENFYWCNATSGGAGLHGTTSTGMALYMQLTGDRFVKKVVS